MMLIGLVAASAMVIAAASGQKFSFIPNGVFFPNPGGASQTLSTAGGGIGVGLTLKGPGTARSDVASMAANG
ncbi:MAG: hypothetical protein WAR21_04010 [Candidatus Acidiferrales bacterium]